MMYDAYAVGAFGEPHIGMWFDIWCMIYDVWCIMYDV